MVWESVANSSARKVTWSTTSGSNPQPSSHATLKAGAVRELRKDCRDAVCLSTIKQTPRYAKLGRAAGIKTSGSTFESWSWIFRNGWCYMQLEVGKCYVDRKGRVFGPLDVTDTGFFGEGKFGDWYPNGRASMFSERPVDLIAEYIPDPLPVVQKPDINYIPKYADGWKPEQELRHVASGMLNIIFHRYATNEEREAAASTLVEAVYPEILARKQ